MSEKSWQRQTGHRRGLKNPGWHRRCLKNPGTDDGARKILAPTFPFRHRHGGATWLLINTLQIQMHWGQASWQRRCSGVSERFTILIFHLVVGQMIEEPVLLLSTYWKYRGSQRLTSTEDKVGETEGGKTAREALRNQGGEWKRAETEEFLAHS